MLSLSTPTTSRELMHEIQQLRSACPSAVPHSSRSCCAACGSLLLPQWTVDSKMTAKRVKTGKGGEVSRRKVRAQRCSICRRVTRDAFAVNPSPRRRREQPIPASEKPVEETTPSDAILDRTTKTSSKKRAKARKDREGLQNLLDQSVHTRATPGLSLVDLMKR